MEANLDIYNSVLQDGENGMYADELSYIYHDGVIDLDHFFVIQKMEIFRSMSYPVL